MNAAMMRIAAGLALAFAVSASTQGMDHTQSRSIGDTGSPLRFAADLDRAFKRSRSMTAKAAADTPIEIHLVLHVLAGPAGEGNLDDATLAAQMSVLNEAYRASGLHFGAPDVRRYPDSPYFGGGCYPTTAQGQQMRRELAVSPLHSVNVYICQLPLEFIAGRSTLPDEFPEGDPQHGVVLDYRTFPGGAPGFEFGHTLVHELGHYFGLLHTFQGGCTEPGDSVEDTPAEADGAHGCPIGRDSCAQAGIDPVTNFMDDSEDACTNNFTPLQAERMHALIAAYRPHLLASAFAIGPGMTGNWYAPDQAGHGFIVEVLANNILLAEWFVFAPDGGPAWIVATGPIDGDTAVLDAYQTDGPGGRFPPHFDPTQLTNRRWGSLTFRFTDCDSGQASWQPVAPGYAAGSMSVKRLTLPAGLSCP